MKETTTKVVKAVLRTYNRDVEFYDRIIDIGIEYDWGLTPYENFDLGNVQYCLGSNQQVLDLDDVIGEIVRVYHDSKCRYTAVYAYPEMINSECWYHWTEWDGDAVKFDTVPRPLDEMLEYQGCEGLGAKMRFRDLPQRIQDAIIADLENDWWSWMPIEFKQKRS